jgi:3-methyladenine DNA glycosylase AlkD
MHPLATTIRKALVQLSDIPTKEGAERYFRGVIPFHGVKTPALNTLYRKLQPELKALSIAEALDLAEALLSAPFAEEKGMAIRLLNSRRKELDLAFLERFEPTFRTHVFDWGTADGLSGKVFRYLIERGEKKLINRIVLWRNDSSLWMQRMAAVSFVCLARHGAVTAEVLKVCSTTIKNPERFAQLGTGWVLRELWLAEPERVEAFIETHYHRFSREGLRYAIEKMPKIQQKLILERYK